MSVYKNPKDGSTLSQMPKIATNIEMVDQPQEDFVTQEQLELGLAEKVDWVTQGKLGAKNLIPFPYPESTLSRRGVDWTVNNDGSILANGEIGADLHYSYIKVGSFTKVKEGAYVISISPSPNEIYIESRLEGAQGIIKRYGESHDYNGFAFTITSDDASLVNENDDVYFVINIIVNDNRGTVVDNVLLYPMMRYATDTDNTYQPYAMTNKELTDNVNALNDLPIKKVGVSSLILGDITHNTARGSTAIAEGFYTNANGNNSHAEGTSTQANGNNSHAEGQNTKATQTNSHAEGNSTQATGINAHAEGNSTQATGINAHAEGNSTMAINTSAHAEGGNTNAAGQYSHSQNYGTNAQGLAQTTIGRYNVLSGSPASKVDTDHALIIGNGTDADHRSNALAVQWDGTVVFQDGSKQKTSPYGIMGKMGAKNLIPYPYFTSSTELAGITFTVDDKGVIIANGTTTSAIGFKICDVFPLKAGKYKIADFCERDSDISLNIDVVSSIGGYISNIIRVRDGQVAEFEITEQQLTEMETNNNHLTLLIYFNAANITVDNFSFYPMIWDADDLDNTYQPYAPTNYELYNTKIAISDLKTLVAASSDFADFQTRIAAL